MAHTTVAVTVFETASESARCPLCERPGALFETLNPDYLGVECHWCDFSDLEEIAAFV
ncbi:hypothetical protein [uncultured Aeromicrobium sp.]|uniref:hypothetical protein n=1 Tax=uncultured Aeromicrobium sp. TaxID=337820 RepID=UPI0025CD4FC2|nr:hypothetical protein [uncultured Aeromicrobium sp.]